MPAFTSMSYTTMAQPRKEYRLEAYATFTVRPYSRCTAVASGMAPDRWLDTSKNIEQSGTLAVCRTSRSEKFAPTGLEDSAQGFNPGKYPLKRFALKGREMIT